MNQNNLLSKKEFNKEPKEMLKGKQQCRIYELSTTPNVLKEQHPKLEIKLALFPLQDFSMWKHWHNSSIRGSHQKSNYDQFFGRSKVHQNCTLHKYQTTLPFKQSRQFLRTFCHKTNPKNVRWFPSFPICQSFQSFVHVSLASFISSKNRQRTEEHGFAKS